jgi:hypothetical protein
MRRGETFTDSAGVTVRYTPIEELQAGDVVVIGWRTTVDHVDVHFAQACVWWEGQTAPDQWNPLGTLMPVVVQP